VDGGLAMPARARTGAARGDPGAGGEPRAAGGAQTAHACVMPDLTGLAALGRELED